MMDSMLPMDPRLGHIQRLGQWRGRRETDLSMAFLEKQFKQQVERPFKQLQSIVPLWESLLPAELAGHTRLESLSRGVLRVAVDSSTHLYELDRLLRAGLEKQLVTAHKGPAMRRIQLRVASFQREPDGPAAPPSA